ncbi:MAG: sensor histidine kinase [Nitriliruptoraceae bacterium]
MLPDDADPTAGADVAEVTSRAPQRAPAAEREATLRDALARERAALARERDALARERAASEELRRIAAVKDALLSAVSHELRTPLTVLQGFAELLLTVGEGLEPSTRDAAVVAIERNARRLNELLASILDLDRLQREATVLNRRQVPVAEVVADVLDALHLGADRVELDLTTITVHADRGKLERVVENLVANALKHGGEDPILIRTWAEEGGVVLEVADHGRGVPAPARERIFQPFDRSGAEEATPGTGIGLALVRGFTELHGGRAWVEDRPEGGASFRVWLPAIEAEEGA